MNPKPIFKLFNPRGKTQAVVQQGVSTLIISSVALSLLALTAYIQVVLADEPLASEQPSIEVLPNIDPADRKFFSPGYGAQTVMSTEAQVLLTVLKDEVDPDQDIGLLEFFSPGHGAISGGSKEAEALPTIETAMDGDLGLMEFFTRPNEAGAPQAIETDADQDIGLMEFRPQASGGLR
jgi:hypothetical protein